MSLRNDLDSLPALLQQAVEMSPNQVAIQLHNHQYSYNELHNLVYSVAYELWKEFSIIPGSYIGHYFDTDTKHHGVIGALAIMSIGCVYVPMNAADPVERLKDLINSICPTIILTQSHLLHRLPIVKNCLIVDLNNLIQSADTKTAANDTSSHNSPRHLARRQSNGCSVFFESIIQSTRQQNPRLKSAELAEIMLKQWNALSSAEKSVYKSKAAPFHHLPLVRADNNVAMIYPDKSAEFTHQQLLSYLVTNTKLSNPAVQQLQQFLINLQSPRNISQQSDGKFNIHSNIPAQFQECVYKSANKIAVRLDNEQLTYGELHARVYDLADHILNTLNIKPGCYIGQFVDRSIEMIIGK
jgi:non-ribosomal peptide synthetase component F